MVIMGNLKRGASKIKCRLLPIGADPRCEAARPLAWERGPLGSGFNDVPHPVEPEGSARAGRFSAAKRVTSMGFRER